MVSRSDATVARHPERLRCHHRAASGSARTRRRRAPSPGHAANLLPFAALASQDVKLGVAFYLWVGIFNVTVIAQFWSFASDIYSPEQGKRLFAVLGVGSSVGAVAGARIAKLFAGAGPSTLMLVAAGLLLVCTGLLAYVDRHHVGGETGRGHAPEEPSIRTDEAFRTFVGDRFLVGIGMLTVLLNWANNTGEYMLDRALLDSARSLAAAQGVSEAELVAGFKADYLSYYSVAAVLLQAFVVSRVMRLVGVGRALFVVPLVSFLGYAAVFVLPALRVVEAVKVADNSLDYSLQNTARNALFLVTGRFEKFVGKAISDTLLVRVGDVLSAVCVAAGVWMAFPLRSFAALNVVLAGAWMIVVVFVGREHDARAAVAEPHEAPNPRQQELRADDQHQPAEGAR